MKLTTVVGARPQFIKMAAVSRAFRARSDMHEVIIHTGQHFDDDMSQVFFEELEIPQPEWNLGIVASSHGARTGRMLESIERVLLESHPDIVIVYGDTDSTLAAGLAAAKLHLPVAHIEAGLRSFNRRMPEEINRVLIDHVSSLLFVPTATAVENLKREGVTEGVHLVGDVMYDVALQAVESAQRHSRGLDELELQPKSYILATIHRAENTDDVARLGAVFDGLGQMAAEVPVVLPLHPRTRKALARGGLLESAKRRLRLLDPVGFLDMTMLLRGARLVVTDSGGVQKEAFFHRVPAITLRDETEWVELIELGWNRLAPPHSVAEVASAISSVLDAPMPAEPDRALYGDGHAAEEIVRILTAT